MKNLANLNSLNNIQPVGADRSLRRIDNDKSGASFKEALTSVDKNQPRQVLKAEVEKKANGLQFSNHAVDRMRFRGIQYSAEQLNKIEGAISKARSKGANETLIITDSSAMIVNVKNNKVVTVMDKNNLKENVFTNIDSTIII